MAQGVETEELMHTDAPQKKRKWWKIPLVVFLLVLVLAGAYVVYYVSHTYRIEDHLALEVKGSATEEAAVGREYTIVTYNVGFGAYTKDFTFFVDGGTESRAYSEESAIQCIEETAKTALSFEPDFALFQEVDTDATRSHHVNQVAQIEGIFAEAGNFDSVYAQNFHTGYLIYPFSEPHGATDSGIVTLSSVNIESSLRRSLPISSGPKKLLDCDRCYSVSRIPADNGKELVLINVHNSAYGNDASRGNAQMEMIFEDMRAEYEKGNYVVCGGDFNHDFTGTSRDILNHGSDETYTWCLPFPAELIPEGFSRCTDYAEGLTPTSRNADLPYEEGNFVVVLDGYIISDNVTCNYVQNIETGYLYTDHNPAVMRFTLEP